MNPLVDYFDLTLVDATRALYMCRSFRVRRGCRPLLYAFTVVMN